MSCPMTNANVEKYKLTDQQVKNFCDKGCSVICEEEFNKKFGGRSNGQDVKEKSD